LEHEKGATLCLFNGYAAKAGLIRGVARAKTIISGGGNAVSVSRAGFTVIVDVCLFHANTSSIAYIRRGVEHRAKRHVRYRDTCRG
jgi:hypothetical protein